LDSATVLLALRNAAMVVFAIWLVIKFLAVLRQPALDG